MGDINHFEYGWVTPTLSYLFSVLGSALGLVCTSRIRTAPTSGQRTWWLILAAWALGGTAIWTMHFMAMLGFAVSGTQIRYDVPITISSALIAVVAVGIGLMLVSGREAGTPRILVGGVVTGLGVAAMHYTGMAAMRLHGSVRYDTTLVALSIVIAVFAATVALWLARTVNRSLVILGSALVMGVAVTGMHYTGMSAMSVHLHKGADDLAGTSVRSLLAPIVLAVIFVIVGLVYALLAAPTEEDMAALAYLDARRAETAAAETVAAVTGSAPDPVGLRGRSTLARPGSSFPSRRPSR